mmetsp:Transcript_69031/g.183950  ORF Transcript_69031/g.183950 Transcript_69031/m.183950 type:complete len:549 (+) Transcript_69031:14-1660(+)
MSCLQWPPSTRAIAFWVCVATGFLQGITTSSAAISGWPASPTDICDAPVIYMLTGRGFVLLVAAFLASHPLFPHYRYFLATGGVSVAVATVCAALVATIAADPAAPRLEQLQLSGRVFGVLLDIAVSVDFILALSMLSKMTAPSWARPAEVYGACRGAVIAFCVASTVLGNCAGGAYRAALPGSNGKKDSAAMAFILLVAVLTLAARVSGLSEADAAVEVPRWQYLRTRHLVGVGYLIPLLVGMARWSGSPRNGWVHSSSAVPGLLAQSLGALLAPVLVHLGGPRMPRFWLLVCVMAIMLAVQIALSAKPDWQVPPVVGGCVDFISVCCSWLVFLVPAEVCPASVVCLASAASWYTWGMVIPCSVSGGMQSQHGFGVAGAGLCLWALLVVMPRHSARDVPALVTGATRSVPWQSQSRTLVETDDVTESRVTNRSFCPFGDSEEPDGFDEDVEVRKGQDASVPTAWRFGSGTFAGYLQSRGSEAGSSRPASVTSHHSVEMTGRTASDLASWGFSNPASPVQGRSSEMSPRCGQGGSPAQSSDSFSGVEG